MHACKSIEVIVSALSKTADNIFPFDFSHLRHSNTCSNNCIRNFQTLVFYRLLNSKVWSLSSWQNWSYDLLHRVHSYYTEKSTTPDGFSSDIVNESPAFEVIRYDSPQGHFASKLDPFQPSIIQIFVAHLSNIAKIILIVLFRFPIHPNSTA